MSSWNSEHKILRISRLDNQRLHFGTASNWLVSKMAEATLVIHGGWIIKSRYGHAPRPVPTGHGDVAAVLQREATLDWFHNCGFSGDGPPRVPEDVAAAASAIRRARRRRRSNTTTKGTT